MPVLRDWELALDADKVLWGQGADPATIRARRPRLAELAEQVIDEGRPLLAPAVFYRRIAVRRLRHECLELAEGGALFGPLVANYLGGAREVIIAICTVGDGLTRAASQLFATDTMRALALDGLASAAAEALGEAACQRFEAMTAAEGLGTSIPLNPGMVGWPLLEGQQQVFSLLDASEIGVQLSPTGLMSPLKSLSLVVGLGHGLRRGGRSCDHCSMHGTCRYRGPFTQPSATHR